LLLFLDLGVGLDFLVFFVKAFFHELSELEIAREVLAETLGGVVEGLTGLCVIMVEFEASRDFFYGFEVDFRHLGCAFFSDNLLFSSVFEPFKWF